MMDFTEAAKRAINGEQMERTSINESIIIMSFELENLRFRNSKGTDKSDCVSAIDITSDWQPHEEHFDLSKKVEMHPECRTGEANKPIYPEEDVKEFIGHLEDLILNDSGINMSRPDKFLKRLNKLAGERFK